MRRRNLRPLLETSVPPKRGRRFSPALRFVVAIVVLAVAAWVYASLPRRSGELGAVPVSFGPIARGILHIHTNRSDGGGTIDDVAAAAARAGLQFVVMTDHGDASRMPDPPSYRSGVLCIDAVEISTENGHLVALGLPQAPYPLGGEGRDVIEDVDRLGGFAIAAHAASPRPSARWTEWTAPFGGIEWLNGDSEWRDERARALARALVTYPFRPAETIATLLDRSDPVMSRWDALTQRRRVVAVAASDAHARFGLPDEDDPVQRRVALAVPGYAAMFKAFSVALSDIALTGRADVDARGIVDAIRRGHVYSVVDGLAGPGALSFSATSGRNHASAGDVLAVDGPVRIQARLHGPPDARIVLLRNGARIAESKRTLEHTVDASRGVFRVEVYTTEAPGQPAVPWIVSNPIYVGWPEAAVIAPPRAAAAIATSLDGMASWTIEHSASSKGAVDIVPAAGGEAQALFRFALAGTPASFPYVAMVIPHASGLPQHDRLMFRIRAEKPMRISVQLRQQGKDAERWHRSVYADSTPRDVTVFFDEMRARGEGPARRLPLQEIGSILFVVDSVNTKVGTSGQVWIDRVSYGR
jgi:hypothetical protein